MKESKSHNSKNFRNEWQNWGENRKFKRHFRNENSGRRNRIEWDNTLRKIENRRDGLFNTTKERKGIWEKKKNQEFWRPAKTTLYMILNPEEEIKEGNTIIQKTVFQDNLPYLKRYFKTTSVLKAQGIPGNTDQNNY